MTPPTASPEPLVLTLEEAMRMNALNSEGEYPFVDVWVNAEGEWWTKSLGAPKQQHAGWPEAYSVAFGRPVVARDEAAEMRAENAKLRAAARAWLAAERHTRIINAGATPEARRAYREARGVLKRLAETLAGEEERA